MLGLRPEGGLFMPQLATQPEIESFLERNVNWSRHESALISEFTAPSFLTAIDFVNTVAVIAERLDHHPDIDIRWNKVIFALSTHSAGGITALDFELAKAIDAASGKLLEG
jgi:4a-hydroxytetrahydrobiopterin dehydratase